MNEQQQQQASAAQGEMIDWERAARELAAPFDPECVDWRPAGGGGSGKGGAGKRVQLVAYVDARAVQDRLDTVVGISGWSFTLEPIAVEGGELRVARGRLTVYGVAKDDVGTASNWEPSKGCASDALKRAAVQFGVGRYLYDLPPVWCELDERGNVPDAMRAKLAEALRRRAPAQQLPRAIGA